MTARRPLLALLLLPALLAAALPGCGGGGGGGGKSTTAPVTSSGPGPTSSAAPTPATSATGTPPASSTPALGRGLTWVRTNPMVITGLNVVMPAPTPTHARAYFDDFAATAVHLWETGLPNEAQGWMASSLPGARWISWVDRDGTSRDGGQLLGGLGRNPAGRIGYQIGDEPPDLAALLQMEAGALRIRAVDPDGLTICNVVAGAPDIGVQLDTIGRSAAFDVFSYDDYRRSNSVYLHMQRIRTAALRAGKPYWRYMNGFDFHGMPTESAMRWDAFSGLVYGFTGHHWFIYQIERTNPDLSPAFFDRKGDYEAPRSARYAQAAQINRELANLGRSITQLTSTDVRYVPPTPLLQPNGTIAWAPGAGGDTTITHIQPDGFHGLLVGHFVDDAGERYVMIQNTNHADGTWPSDSTSSQTISVDLDFGTSPTAATDRVLVLDKLTGQVVSTPLQVKTAGRSGTLRVTLEAGDPILFKYATGRPFALR